MGNHAEVVIDPFQGEPAGQPQDGNLAAALVRWSASLAAQPPARQGAGVAVLQFEGFDLGDQPLVSGVAALPGEVLVARSTVPLRLDMIGSQAVAVFEDGDPNAPIILGILQKRNAGARPGPAAADAAVPAQAGQAAPPDQLVISAEREVVLQCGQASITLTRAGKVLIKGSYVLSRSTGHNKIKGAAIEIN